MKLTEPMVARRDGPRFADWTAPRPGGTARLVSAQLFQVDAFATRAFEGNPAAVCLLDAPREAEWMQRVAAEINLSETAFLVPSRDGWSLRWFTPTVEVALCGHATLAAAHVLWDTARASEHDPLRFQTRSGTLTARRRCSRVEIDLPASGLREVSAPRELLEALGEDVAPRFVGQTSDRGCGDSDYLLVLEHEAAVRALRPDFARLRHVRAGVIVTARGEDGSYDVVSRYFAPCWGIDEDPVTGSAHCALIPYWAGRLGKRCLVAFQASRRGGVLSGRVVGGRVLLAGRAATVSQGLLFV